MRIGLFPSREQESNLLQGIVNHLYTYVSVKQDGS